VAQPCSCAELPRAQAATWAESGPCNLSHSFSSDGWEAISEKQNPPAAVSHNPSFHFLPQRHGCGRWRRWAMAPPEIIPVGSPSSFLLYPHPLFFSSPASECGEIFEEGTSHPW
jgi:hypothetical protein